MKITENLEQQRLWKNYSLDIAYAGLAQLGREWRKEDVCSPFSRLYYTLRGEGSLFGSGQTIRLRAGCVCLVPAGLNFSYRCDETMEQLFFHVNLTHSNGIDLFRSCREVYTRMAGKEELERLRLLYGSKNPADAFRLQGLLTGELAGFMEQAAIGEKQTGACSHLVEQMFALAGSPVCAGNHVRSLARQLHVSESTLSRRFRAETGMTPGDYLEQLVISRACRLLLMQDHTIAQVAEELGFSDQFYFTKYFKRRMQVTPSVYRKQMRAG